ncbi:MAG: hypothetical protein Q8P86_03130 [bacterium]|nr:hypothetical protein [bacterium]
MQTKNAIIWVFIAVVIALIGFRIFNKPDVETETPFVHPYPVKSSDTISSWNFEGAYKDGGELEERANANITRLRGLFGNGEYTDYELYISLASQYDSLGDGEKAYENLGRALVIDSQNSGLAWNNMGALMVQLGALDSAREAYDRAIEAQPIPVYYNAKINFLERYFPENEEEIKAVKEEAGQAGEY